jgi:hypothetical protein
VVTGEQITWQPVVTKDNERPWPAAEDLPSDDYDDEDEDEDRARRRRRSAAGAKPVPSAKTKQRRQVVVLSVLSGIVVLVAILGFVLSRGAAKKGSQAAPPSPSSSVPGTTVPASQLDTIHDTVTGFTVKVPKAWVSVKPPEADIRLVMQAGNNDGFSVRVIPIQTPATQDNIGNFKAVTDAIVFGDNTNQEIQESLVTLNGRLTYYYLYTFPSGGQQGVHAHYFVFEGHRMFALVFQAVPSDDFTKLAAVFDQVAESFTVQDEATLPPTTTIPPPSSSTPPTTG